MTTAEQFLFDAAKGSLADYRATCDALRAQLATAEAERDAARADAAGLREKEDLLAWMLAKRGIFDWTENAVGLWSFWIDDVVVGEGQTALAALQAARGKQV